MSPVQPMVQVTAISEVCNRDENQLVPVINIFGNRESSDQLFLYFHEYDACHLDNTQGIY